ncbi:MAG: DHH family phosphoesterase [Candidatus Caldarchaeum sp.]
MRDHSFISEVHKTLQHHIRGRRVQVLSHWGGDADSVGSAYVMCRLLTQNYEATEAGFLIPEESALHVKAIMQHLRFEEKPVETPDVYLLVDVGSPHLLGEYKDNVYGSGKPIISIDHHVKTVENSETIALVSPKYLATAEIVYDLVEYLNLVIDKEMAEALFLGIYYDTVRLSIGDEEVASKASKLLQKINPYSVLGMLEPRGDDAERIARLKGLRRATFYRLGDWFVAVSRVNSYLSSVARTLVNAGAHVALVAGEKGEHTILAARGSYDFQKFSGVGLGNDLVNYLLRRFEGDGGGHVGAARLRLKAPVEKVIEEAVKGLSMLLSTPAVELAE